MTPRPAQRTTVTVLPRILAAALLAAACSDSVGPARGPAPPLFSFSPNGIRLDQANSGLPQPGRRFVKGFNPTNPQNGDAIVVTLFWVGNTYIVDSVTDRLVASGFPKVGNTYQRVEYVTVGGISMATFVATNVQNIPLANPNGEDVLAIEADLADSVPDGGIMMSAYSGVEDVFATALGAHVSRSGSGSAPTPVHPGTLTTTTPGALVYGVAMSRPPINFDPPPGWSSHLQMMGLADGTIQADGRFLVAANPTSVDPTWTWFYDQTRPGTWLATGLVLNAATSSTNQYPVANFTSSCSGMTCSFSSTSTDPDGTISTYSWSFGDGAPMVTTPNATHMYGPSGTFIVSLTVRDNQGATHSVQHSVTVPGGSNQPPVANFTSSCPTLTCNFTSTSSDPDGTIAGYSWNFGDGSPVVTTQNPSHTYGAGGNYTVTLTVTDNLGATNARSQGVTVNAANQPPVANFTSSCPTLTCSFTSTSSDPDGSIAGYSWNFGDGSPVVTTQNPSHTYGAGGTYTVTLTVTDNQGGTNSHSQGVTVTAGNQAPVAAFNQSCSGLDCTFTDRSTDPDGTLVAWNWTSSDGATSTEQNPPTYTYAQPR